ncbi:MAG: hypothetical protein WBR35_09965 [Anaerolineae bacterium]
MFELLQKSDDLQKYQGCFGRWLVAIDGTQYFGSQKIHCPQCTTRLVNGCTHYSHVLVALVIVAPGENRVIALEPEFVQPQDGCEKQDCELLAASNHS